MIRPYCSMDLLILIHQDFFACLTWRTSRSRALGSGSGCRWMIAIYFNLDTVRTPYIWYCTNTYCTTLHFLTLRAQGGSTAAARALFSDRSVQLSTNDILSKNGKTSATKYNNFHFFGKKYSTFISSFSFINFGQKRARCRGGRRVGEPLYLDTLLIP